MQNIGGPSGGIVAKENSERDLGTYREVEWFRWGDAKRRQRHFAHNGDHTEPGRVSLYELRKCELIEAFLRSERYLGMWQHRNHRTRQTCTAMFFDEK